MKEIIITSEQELALSFRNYLTTIDLPGLRIQNGQRQSPHGDDLVEADIDKRSIRFIVHYKLNPGARDLEAIAPVPGSQHLLEVRQILAVPPDSCGFAQNFVTAAAAG